MPGGWNDGQPGMGYLTCHQLGVNDRRGLIFRSDHNESRAGNNRELCHGVGARGHRHQIDKNAADRRAVNHPASRFHQLRPVVQRRRAQQLRKHGVGDCLGPLRQSGLRQMKTCLAPFRTVGLCSGVGKHQGAKSMTVFSREGQIDVSAHGEPHQHRLLNLDVIEERSDVVGIVVERKGPERGIRLAMTAKVHSDGSEFSGQRGDLRLPH